MVDAEEISRQYVQSITPAKKDVVVGNTWCPLCGAVYGPEKRCCARDNGILKKITERNIDKIRAVEQSCQLIAEE